MTKRDDVIKEAMSLLGQSKSEKKLKALAENRALRHLKPLDEIPCTCGKCPDDPKTYCNKGRAIIRRRKSK